MDEELFESFSICFPDRSTFHIGLELLKSESIQTVDVGHTDMIVSFSTDGLRTKAMFFLLLHGIIVESK